MGLFSSLFDGLFDFDGYGSIDDFEEIIGMDMLFDDYFDDDDEDDDDDDDDDFDDDF